MIYHYTSLEKLKLILQNRKIRFTRLDKVDDRDESEPFKNKRIADKIFVSCWTEDTNENLALWSMYGDSLKGVRIGFKRPIFKFKEVLDSSYNGLRIFNSNNKKVLFLPSEVITESYFIIPSFIKEDTFFRKIEYVKPDELETKYDKYSNFTVVNGLANITLNFYEIAKYKKDGWQQQLESRYVLGIIPYASKLNFVPDFSNQTHVNIITSNLSTALVNEIKPEFTYFDVELDYNCFNNIEIMIGAKGDKKQAEILLNEFCTNYKITKSELNM